MTEVDTTQTEVETVSRGDLMAARSAGASNVFILLASIDPTEAQVKRNFVADRLARYDSPEAIPERAGDFLGSLWDGDLAEALYHADGTNSRLMIRVLSDDLLLSALAADRGSMESARKWYHPYRERYGWPRDSE